VSAPLSHPIFARVFDRVAPKEDERGHAELRRELLTGLTGRAVELGAGNGLTFAHYPPAVDGVVAVEPEPYLRGRAEAAARTAPVPIRVVDGVAAELPFPDAAFDAAVAIGVLCSVVDLPAALHELRRVLVPGGELRFLEHVRSRDSLQRWIQDAIDRPWAALNGGCHPNRDTLSAIERSGFEVVRCRRFSFPPGARLCPAGPRILGVAVRP
jgi:ubiquinone/menaquinone biosynthesis C-methylase UbiE